MWETSTTFSSRLGSYFQAPHTTRDFPVSRLSSSLLMAPLPPDGRVLIVFFLQAAKPSGLRKVGVVVAVGVCRGVV